MDQRLRKPDPSLSRIVITVTLILGALITFAAQHYAARSAVTSLSEAAAEALALQDETLNGVLEKYRLLPAVLASRPDVTAFATPGADPARTEHARTLAREISSFTGALDIAFIDSIGAMVASGSGLLTQSHFADPRVASALNERRLGRADVTLPGGERAYLFATTIPASRGEKGAVAVLVPFSEIEAAWSLSRNPIFVTDTNERVFLSNRAEWIGKIWQETPTGASDPLSRYDVNEPGKVMGPQNIPYVEAARAMPLLEWTLHVLIDARPVATARLNAGVIAALASAMAGILALILLRRRQLAIRQMRRDRALALTLERRVRDRTAQLVQTNHKLSQQIEVRIEAEKQLRATQNELIHAAKLATIGQMSAALSHEYNQPLGAIRTYADNARAFLKLEKVPQADDALDRITGLVERMSALSRSLLSFSRKPGTELRDIPVTAAMEESLMLVRLKAQKAGIELETDFEDGLMAHTGRTRLAQIIVNLVSNSIDALRGDSEQAPAHARITLSTRRTTDAGGKDRIEITVSDNGPGIPANIADKMFVPFFTTKDDGKGSGLGLAIVENIVRDLLGAIHLDTTVKQGACFRITIPASVSAPDSLAEAAA